MATFIDFAKPLADQLGLTDEGEEFKLIRRTTDGKGWVWKALEEDNETFTTIGAPTTAEDLFEGFQSFVETGNPTRFTGMEGIQGGAGRFLTDAGAAYAAAQAAGAAQGGGADAFGAFVQPPIDPTIDPATGEPWDRPDQPAMINGQPLPVGNGTVDQGASVPTNPDGSLIDTSKWTGDDWNDWQAGQDVQFTFDPFVEMGKAKEWALSQKMGMPITNPIAEGVPDDWLKLSRGIDPDGNFIIPRNVVAWWYMSAVQARNAEIIKQRDEVSEAEVNQREAYDLLSPNEKMSKIGQSLSNKIKETKAEITSLTQLQTQSQEAVNNSLSVFKGATQGKPFDLAALSTSYEQFSPEKIKAAAAGTPITTTGTGVTPTIGTEQMRDGVMQRFDGTTWKPVTTATEEPGGPLGTGVPGEIKIDPLTDEPVDVPDAPWMIDGERWDGTQEQAQKILDEQQLGTTVPPLGGGTAPPLTGGTDPLGAGADVEAYIAEMEGLNVPFEPEAIRQLGYQQQTPFTAWTRLGLQGALTPEGTPTTDLSTFAQGALQDYFGRTVEPGYAAALAQASQQRARHLEDPSVAAAPEFQTGFEQFARGAPGEFGVGRASPDQLRQQQQQLIETLQGKTRMTDPYREELLSYLGDIDDPTNIRLMGALGRPTLGQISPIYRAAAQKRMQSRLQNLMAMQPERSLVSFFGGEPKMKQSWLGAESPFAQYAQGANRTIQ